ncbi:MAG: hypothetical protein WAW17_14605 [Rhodococcus sp. (in: high G+C Gram-positive bacteria)]|uniref:hypothetical protein n=1 Tax=Rhodococcus sp. TaxID=1831 RepID=UPI003BAFBDA7
MTTSIAEGFSPNTGSGTGLLDALNGNAGLPPSAIANPSGQVQASPNVVPEAAPPFGDAGDWGRWGAVALGTTALSGKVSTNVTQPLKDDLRTKYDNLVRFQNSPAEIQGRVQKLQNARNAAIPSTLGRAKEGTAGARSVFSRFGANVVDKAASKVPTGRTVVSLARGATSAVASRVGPKAAALGARLGMRLALFAIPGPGWAVGAAVLVATWLFDSSMRRFVNNLVGKAFGVNNSPALDAPPEPPRTQFLPLTHDGDRDSVIDTKDAEMVQLNDAAFAFDPSKVWHPTAPAIETTPMFEKSTQVITDLIATTVGLREELGAILRKYRGEQVVDRAGESMKQALESLDEFGATVLPAVSNLIAASASDTNTLYMKLRGANNAARQEIANSGSGVFPWTANVEAGNMGQLAGEFEKFAQQQDANIQAVNAVFTDWTPPTTSTPGIGTANLPSVLSPSVNRSAGAGAGTSGGSAPTTSAPASTSPRSGSEPSGSKDGSSKQAITDALRGIGTPAATNSPASQNPLSQMTNPLAQMNNPLDRMQNPMSQMGGGMNPFGQMQNPLAQMGGGTNTMPAALPQPNAAAGKSDSAKLESKLRDLLGTDKAKDTVAEKRSDKAKDEDAKDGNATRGEDAATDATPTAEPPKASPAPAPGLPSALGVETPAPGDHAADEPKSRTANIGGKTVEFEDPRSARMAEILKPTDGSTPVTVQEAAAQSGYTLPPAGEPIGKVIPTADLRPGDLIMGDGDRNGLYIGDAKVLSGGEVRPVGDIAHFTDDGQGIFRLEDGATPAPVAGDALHAGDAPAPAPDVPPAADVAPGGEAQAPTGDVPPTGDSPTAHTQSADLAAGDTPASRDSTSGGAQAPAGTDMPLPRASIPTSDTDLGSSSPAVPSVPVGD